MTIANGQDVTKADLDAFGATALLVMRVNMRRAPLGHVENIIWRGVVSGLDLHRRQRRFVVPWDCYLETVRVQTDNMTGDVTVTLSSNTDLNKEIPAFGVTIEETVTSARTALDAVLFDGTKTRDGARAFRTLTKGSTVTVTAETTNTEEASSLQVALVLRAPWGRE